MKSCLAPSATEQRLPWANKRTYAHTFVLTHLPLPSVVCSPNKNGEIVSHLLPCLISVNLSSVTTKKHPIGNQNNHLLLSKEALSSETMTPTRVPVPRRTLSNMFSLNYGDRTDMSHFKLKPTGFIIWGNARQKTRKRSLQGTLQGNIYSDKLILRVYISYS